jgi:hypothetical protein
MEYPEEEMVKNKIVKQHSLISCRAERHDDTKWHLEMITLQAQIVKVTES